jgi:2-polyprenyl-6-methoxyphenol hydroxylase-like FAD-dependent oxidoreductase
VVGVTGTGLPADTDVLVVGAGPTGLSLALELAAQGTAFRIIDSAPDAVHESRALAIQARTLEVLDRHGVADRLVAAGDPATTVMLHTGARATRIPLFDQGFAETAYPFVLFVSQATTEQILIQRLAEYEVQVERGTSLTGLVQDPAGVTCELAATDGNAATVRARYVVGCDGAHSVVRRASGMTFAGTAFPQTFVLADLEADGLEPGRIHGFLDARGLMFFFPLGAPAPWRLLVMRPPEVTGPTTTGVLQRIAAAYTGGRVHVHDPVWLTDFSIHSRRADRFRSGRVLLAGDAAHIHSPAGAQGMNTGIQDAVNLGWKLALVCADRADGELLDSYEAERLPVARSVLRMTGRAFRIATSTNRALTWARPRVGAAIAPIALRIPAVRRTGFRVISELAVRYRHSSLNGRSGDQRSPRRWSGPRAGDRFPDAAITVDGHATTLYRSLNPAGFHLVLCGPPESWTGVDVDDLLAPWEGLVQVTRLTTTAGPGVWADAGDALRRLRLDAHTRASYLVRPDRYIAHRTRGTSLHELNTYLARVLRPARLV